jgi:hypothetical protein
MRLFAAFLLAAFLWPAMAQDRSLAPTATAAKMRAGVEAVLDALPAPLRAQATKDFQDRDRLEWHYTPRSRNGVSFKEMDAKAREAVHALLRTALSAAGHRKVTNIIELELVLREMETFGFNRDPERYHLTVYGRPDATGRWGWRFEGHHLSLNFTLAGDKMAVDSPSFFGASPATVPRGPKKGQRALGEEHDAGWAVFESLDAVQRKEAVIAAQTYGEIVTHNAAKVEPLSPAGIAAGRLDERQRALLWKLVETYAASFQPGLAQARLARAKEGGVEALRFAWAGATVRGRPHYYRVQGPKFLIEYDASQNDGNHIHTVWRDFTGDFGRDLLREHYAMARGSRHRH